MRRAYLSLGSNIGDRLAHLVAGVTAVADGEEYRVSSVYETAPVGGVVQDDFLNVVMELVTDDSPEELLARAQRAEVARNRTREVHWGPRTLDVDVLLVGDERRDDPFLTVPHPRMWERRFVLVPLRELAPVLVSDGALAAATGDVVMVGTLPTIS